MKKSNISFQYLHRDESNYKEFGETIFPNRKNFTPEEAANILRRKLIDTEYFYPLENGISLFPEHLGLLYFSDWYEFEKLSRTAEEPTDKRDLSYFLSNFKT